MEKVLLTTTLKLIIEKNPCIEDYETLINYLGKYYPDDEDDKPINLLTILESNGVGHCLWAFSCTQQDSKRISMLIGADIAESVLHLFEKVHPEDNRPREAIQATRDCANGLISEETLQIKASAAYAADAYAAYAAASAAGAGAAGAAYAAYAAATYRAADAAAHAVYAVALAAAYDAAAYADADAARAVSHDAYAAASAAEHHKQSDIIRKYLKEDSHD